MARSLQDRQDCSGFSQSAHRFFVWTCDGLHTYKEIIDELLMAKGGSMTNVSLFSPRSLTNASSIRSKYQELIAKQKELLKKYNDNTSAENFSVLRAHREKMALFIRYELQPERHRLFYEILDALNKNDIKKGGGLPDKVLYKGRLRKVHVGARGILHVKVNGEFISIKRHELGF